MTELQSILSALNAAKDRGEPAVLATVVNVEGSAYRRPGARMLVMKDGSSIGTISGGCLESDVVERAWELTAEGVPAMIRYDASGDDDPEWGFGLGCNGTVDLLLERIDPLAPPPFLDAVRTALASRTPIMITSVYARKGEAAVALGTGLVSKENEAAFSFLVDVLHRRKSHICNVNTGAARAFVEYITPPPHLLVLGAGHDAVPVVRLAAATGFQVSVCDRRSAFATADRFPTAQGVYAVAPEETLSALPAAPDAAVIMTHRYPEDVRLLRILFDSPARYIGVLGPRDRTDRLLRDLKRDGFTVTAEMLRRLHAPVGLDLGAETPEEIALAIVSEAVAALAEHTGGKLRDKGGPIHEHAFPPHDVQSAACNFATQPTTR